MGGRKRETGDQEDGTYQGLVYWAEEFSSTCNFSILDSALNSTRQLAFKTDLSILGLQSNITTPGLFGSSIQIQRFPQAGQLLNQLNYYISS